MTCLQHMPHNLARDHSMCPFPFHIPKHFGATHTACNVLHGWLRGQKNEQQNNVPNPKKQKNKKNNAAAGCHCPLKIELLKGAGLLNILSYDAYLGNIGLEKY